LRLEIVLIFVGRTWRHYESEILDAVCK